MTELNDELQALREMAYGRGAARRLDAQDLQRLRELERQAAESATASAAPVVVALVPAFDEELDGSGSESDPAVGDAAESIRAPNRPRVKIRRSTLLMIVGLAVFATIVATTLTLVQRVQTDPLQPDARQVARLAVDRDYEIPDIIDSFADGTNARMEAFSEFHGLRAFVSPSSAVIGAASKDKCLIIYRASDLERATSDQLSGPSFYGCSAGPFPAMAQSTLHDRRTGLPEELRTAYRKEAALQFVYDRADDEVVVFASR